MRLLVEGLLAPCATRLLVDNCPGDVNKTQLRPAELVVASVSNAANRRGQLMKTVFSTVEAAL